MQTVEFGNGPCTGKKYLEMKYYLTEQDKLESIKDNFGAIAARNNESLPTPTADEVIEERERAIAMAKTIPSDAHINAKMIQDAIDKDYQNGEFLLKNEDKEMNKGAPVESINRYKAKEEKYKSLRKTIGNSKLEILF